MVVVETVVALALLQNLAMALLPLAH